jgi:hypothetical protein
LTKLARTTKESADSATPNSSARAVVERARSSAGEREAAERRGEKREPRNPAGADEHPAGRGE